MQTSSAFAPGRVELLGNHTDYNGGVVLSASINLGISAQGRVRPDQAIRLTSAENPATTAQLEKLLPQALWSDYPLGVASMLLRAGHPLGGFEMEFTSTLPVGAGLSSSAALEVATGVLLMRLFGFKIAPLDLAKLCRNAENDFVGVRCGLLDQVSSIFGKKDHAIFLDCRSEKVETLPFPPGVGLLVIHSGVKHALTGGEYNERREQCFAAAKTLGVSALRDVTSSQLAAADLTDLIKRRAAHVVGENERVLAAVGSLQEGDIHAFGRLMTTSHHSSIENFENSTPELDALVEIAIAKPGVYGARLTGGGFGGAIVALVAQEGAARIADNVVADYKAKTGHQATAYRCAIADGALAAK